VCPTHSIWVGDLDDPESGIAKLVASNETAVRSPEQNTGPNVFYLGADRAVLDPLAAPVDDTYIWAKPDAQRLENAGDLTPDPVTNARTTLNTAHPRPWGWKVVTYLWTKGIGAGALALALVAHLMGIEMGVVGDYVAPALGLFGAATTGALLVWDLKRPERFLYIFLKSNFGSWLVLGAYVLTAFSGGAILWMLAIAFDVGWAMTVLAWVGIPVSALMAAYTAFLFGQAEGRDLWQSPVLFWHLIVQALMVGSGALAIAALVADLSDDAWQWLAVAFVASSVLHLALLAVEYGGTHRSHQATVAARIVSQGRYARLFWLGAVVPTAVAVLLGALTWGGASVVLLALAGVIVQPALLAYESAFVRAGQDPPLS
jgi:formate-dependent nitrite reductase membrane component NrfD